MPVGDISERELLTMETAQYIADAKSESIVMEKPVEDGAAFQQFYIPTPDNESDSETPMTPDLEFETGPDGSVRIPLAMVFNDGSVFPRVGLDSDTLERYTAALIRGEKLPPITVEVTKDGDYRILKGVHRFEAFKRRREIYAGKIQGDYYDEPLPSISDTDLNTIPCFIDTIPPDVHPMVFAAWDNLKHGKPLAPEDYNKIANELYKANRGASIRGLAKLVKISRKVFKSYVADQVEQFEREKEALILELDAQGYSQMEISDKLKEKYPKAKGLSQSQISEILFRLKNGAKTVGEDEPGINKDVAPEGLPPDPPSAEPEPEEPQAPANIPKLSIVCGNYCDTIMIRGLESLAPHLQQKLKTSVEELVNQIREKNSALREDDEALGDFKPPSRGETPDES
jgi:hypothetical protein